MYLGQEQSFHASNGSSFHVGQLVYKSITPAKAIDQTSPIFPPENSSALGIILLVLELEIVGLLDVF